MIPYSPHLIMARMSALVRMRIVKVDNGVRGKNNDEFFFSHTNSYMWIPEKQCRCSPLQSRNRDADAEIKHMDTKGEREEGAMNWEIKIDIYTLLILYIKQITNENLLYSSGNSTQCSVVPKWEGNPTQKEHVYMYSWFTLLYSRNQWNIGKQPYSNKNQF